MPLHSKLVPPMKISPEKLFGNNLVNYLIRHPETTGNIKFRQFSSLCWVKLLSYCPQFAEQCDFSKMRVIQELLAVNIMIISLPEVVILIKKIKKEFPVTIFLLLSVKNFNNLRRL